MASAGLWTARSADPADVLARAAGYRFASLVAAALVVAGIAAAVRLPGRAGGGDRPSGQGAVGAQAQ